MKKASRNEKIRSVLYIYRYDIFSLSLMFVIITLILNPLLAKGHIVFSDIAFGFTSDRYMEEIFGLWNERWSTSTMLNLARLIYIFPCYLLSVLFGHSGPVLVKSFIFLLIFNSAFSMYIFTKRLVSVYFFEGFDFFKIFALVTGSLFYALNPWVIIRIQHIYLLCGYSLFPMVLSFFFNAFDPKFQAQLIRRYSLRERKLYRRNVVDIFLLAFTLTVSSGAIHYFFYSAIFLIILGSLVLLKTVLKNKGLWKIIVLNFLKKLGLFSVFFIMLSAYWLVPYIGSIILKAQASQHNVNVIDTLSLFSRNSSVLNVVYMISYWWPMFDIANISLSFYLGGAVIFAFIIYAIVFKSHKHNIIAFFVALTIIFWIIATGTKIPIFAPIFVKIVTKTPIIGSIFRDPNKLVGLMAVGLSIFLTFGIESFYSKLENNLYHNIIKILVFNLVIVSFILYLNPFYVNFIDGFYKPVSIPKEYLELQDHLTDRDKFNSKVMYLPLADSMTRSGTGVATPKWNKNGYRDGIEKATGDIAIYSSTKNTIFHHEGNIPSISYNMFFLQELIDKGYSSNLGSLISAFGVNQLVYQNDYLDKDVRQEFNKSILDAQKGLVKEYTNDIFTTYEVKDKIPYLYSVSSSLYSPYGISSLESYAGVPKFNFKDIGVIFTAIGGKNNISGVNKGDYIDSKNFDDLFLSSLPQELYIKPFDYINDGNAFMKWSKTYTSSQDWMWYLSSQGIKNYTFDYDFNSGIGVTFATSKLDLLPYEAGRAKGNIVMDFDTMLRTEKFFVPDNPQFYQVLANPKDATNDIVDLSGEIAKNEPNNIWQVAKSRYIDVKPDNPYKFNIVVSGRGTNKIHVKAGFYDENMKEMGVSYVVSPREEVNFDKVNFTGEYVSPANSRYMRLDILTMQRPEQKSYWWIHDINIYDYEEYKAKNTIEIIKEFSEKTRAKVYTRVFMSKNGGILEYSIGKKTYQIDTRSADENKFKWIQISEVDFEKGKNNISIENKEGFNAVNMIALVPVLDEEALRFPIKAAIEKSNVFSIYEAESDFTYDGNIQSERAYPKLSFGRGISLQDGYMEADVEILKSTVYNLALKLNSYDGHGGRVAVTLKNKLTGEEFKRVIDSGKFPKKGIEKNIVVDNDIYQDFFPQVYMEINGYLNNYETLVLRGMILPKGEYSMRIDFDSRVPSVSSFADLHKFDPSEIVIPEFVKDIFQEDCSDCETISFDMMQSKIVADVFRIDYEKTCSCDWYDYASRQVPVKVYDEYLFSAELRSENIRKRHMKIMFIDENHKLVDTTYINDIEEDKKGSWNSYEQIIKVPEKAAYMQVHLMTRG